jgi:hypothetical protein
MVRTKVDAQILRSHFVTAEQEPSRAAVVSGRAAANPHTGEALASR